MPGRYKPYANYKDSNIEWIGRVPEHWKASYLGFECSVKARLGWKGLKAEEYVDDGYVFLATPNIKNNEIDFINVNRITKERYDESPEIILEKGDVLVTKDGSTTGTTNIIRALPEPATVNSSIAVLRSKENILSEYLYYFFVSEYTQNLINRMRGGMGVPHLFQADLRKFDILIPAKQEQRFIANFLDHETAKIDTLIEKQKQLIQLLKEKRQAVISHAVTKGLNSDTKMRDSGIEWLGEVPAHWVVRRLKHTSNLQSGIPKGKDLVGKINISVPMLRVANVQDGYLDLNDVHEIAIEPKQLERYSLQYGDVLMNEGGDNDKLGRGAVWKSQISPCIHQNHVFAIRPYSMEPEWLDLLTRASYAKFHFYMVAKQSTNLASISSTNIKETPLVIPPREERQEILDYVFNKLDVFEEVEKNVLTQIVLLQERRTALISAAVTGKIDVRNWIAPKTSKTNKEVAA